MSWLKARLVGYGVLLGTAGVKVLKSDDAKKVYTYLTAATLRGVDDLTDLYARCKEECEDILADAKEENERRAELKRLQIIEDAKAVLAQAEKEPVKRTRKSTKK